MNSQYRLLLQSIEENYNNLEFLPSTATSSSLFISPSNTHQQLFLQKLINIYVLRKKEYNKINQERISHLMKESYGSFTDLLLGMRFMSYCMQNKIEVSYDKFGMLKLLTGWMDILEKIKKEEKINLCRSVLGMIIPENNVVSKVQELIVYLNYIAVDLQQIIERPSQQQQHNQDSTAHIQQSPSKQLPKNFPSHLDIEDLIQFLNNILPKTLYNIVIAENLLINKPILSMNPNQHRQFDFLFSQQSIEYFAKQKSHYQQLLKLLFHTILKYPQLQQPLQRQLMLCVMRYLYVFNRNKHAESFSLFNKVYEKLSEAVRFALSDQFVLFFKILKKIGHTKFIEYLRQKYPFVEELHQKLDTNAIVGYPKDSLNAFHSFPIMQSIFVNPGTMVQRFIQILEPYSLLYFYIGIKSLDINVRFYYMGSFTSPTEKRQLLLNKEKCQVQFKGNIIALEKGIYMFEFDNTYSWMKGKGILYDNMVLTPLDLQKNDAQKDKFLNVLFNKFEMNSCPESIDVKNLGSNNNIMQSVQNNVQNQAQQQKLTVNMSYDPETQIYNLKTVGGGKIYEYETDNQNLFNKKAHEIYGALEQSKGPSAFQWLIGGGVLLSSIALIQMWCNDPLGFKVEEENKVQPVQQQVINQVQQQVINQDANLGQEQKYNQQEKVQVQQKQESLENKIERKVEDEQKVVSQEDEQKVIPKKDQQKVIPKEDEQPSNEVKETVESSHEESLQHQSYPSLISQTTQAVIKNVEQSQHQEEQNIPVVPANNEPKEEQQNISVIPVDNKQNKEEKEAQNQQKLQEIHIDQSQQQQPQQQEQNNQQEDQEEENYEDENDEQDY